MSAQAEDFVRRHTRLATAPMVPEFTLHLASEITPIWQATETWLQAENIAPPFWAFAWPGGQALARHILDYPAPFAGSRVLDFAAGCGIAGLAAARAGAIVEAAEIDPLAIAAIGLNAAANGLKVQATLGDIVGATANWDFVLCGDVCYEAPMTRHILPWLRAMAAAGAQTWIADPGRAYLPTGGMTQLFACEVSTTMELEDRALRRTVVYRLDPGSPIVRA